MERDLKQAPKPAVRPKEATRVEEIPVAIPMTRREGLDELPAPDRAVRRADLVFTGESYRLSPSRWGEAYIMVDEEAVSLAMSKVFGHECSPDDDPNDPCTTIEIATTNGGYFAVRDGGLFAPCGNPSNPADAIEGLVWIGRQWKALEEEKLPNLIPQVLPEREFRVRWEIDLYAETPEQAALKALGYQRNPTSSAVVFDVVDRSKGLETKSVDLAELGLVGEEQPEMGYGGIRQRCSENQAHFDTAWDVFDIGNNTKQIQCDDEVANGFVSDEEAVGYVFLRALGGDSRASSALRTCYGVLIE